MPSTRRAALTAMGALLLPGPLAWAQANPEMAVRQAVAGYVAAWNSKQPQQLAPLLVENVDWVAIYSQPKAGRESVLGYAQSAMDLYAVKLEVGQIRLRDNGNSASALLKGQFMEFPLKDGKYARVWERGAILTRWRLDGGRWLMTYMNENANQSAELAKAEGF